MSNLSDNEYLFTSESVTEGHPDKIADQISDGILDAVLRDDPYGRVACETLVSTGLVVVSGEISTTTYVDIQDIVRSTIRKIGYTDADLGFSADSCAVINAIDKQSPDIAQGVDSAWERRQDGAGEDELDVAGARHVELVVVGGVVPALVRLVDALRDVGRLLVDRRYHRARVAVEAVAGVVVADLVDRLADNFWHVYIRLGRDLTGDHH